MSEIFLKIDSLLATPRNFKTKLFYEPATTFTVLTL